MAMPGVLMVEVPRHINHKDIDNVISIIEYRLKEEEDELGGLALMVLCDDAAFAAASINNFVWVTFTRSNPSHDIYGIGSFTEHKHWGCKGPLIIDARIKPHHAPVLERVPEVEKTVDKLGEKGGSLFGII
jgi:4-hydroxy-3-polyprenylbenzoate decarboxylase